MPLLEEGKMSFWYPPSFFNMSMPFATLVGAPTFHNLSWAHHKRGFPRWSVLHDFPVSDELRTNRRGHWLIGHKYPEGEGFGDLGTCLSLGTFSAPGKGTWYF